jgi:hypothetical protein
MQKDPLFFFPVCAFTGLRVRCSLRRTFTYRAGAAVRYPLFEARDRRAVQVNPGSGGEMQGKPLQKRAD